MTVEPAEPAPDAPSPAPWPWTHDMAPGEPRMVLAALLIPAVPLHMAEMAGWSQERRRRVGLPHGWTALLAAADSMIFPPRTRGRGGRVFDTLARGLAVLAHEPGGVSLFRAHWCAAPHPGCPNGAPTLVVSLDALVARCRWAIGRPEWQEPLAELVALLAAEGLPAPRLERRTVPRTRRPARAPRLVDVPTGGAL